MAVRFGIYSGDPLLAERALRERLSALGDPDRVVLWGDEVDGAGVLEALGTAPLFGEGERAVVVRRAEPLMGDQRLFSALKAGPPEGTAVFFLGEELSGPLTRIAEEHLHFPRPGRRELRELAVVLMRESGLKVHEFVVDLLVDSCGGDTLRLAREVEKLSIWKGGRLPRSRLPELIYSPEPPPYGFLEGLCWRDLPRALRELKGLLERGWDPLRIFHLISGQIRSLIVAKSIPKGQEPEPKWLWRRRAREAGNFTREELFGLLRELQSLDVRIKRGEVDPEAALHLFTLRAAGP